MIVGARLRFIARFKNAGRLFNPAAVTVTVTIGGETTTYSVHSGVKRTSVGEYVFEFLPLTHGTMDVTWASSAEGQESTETQSYMIERSLEHSADRAHWAEDDLEEPAPAPAPAPRAMWHPDRTQGPAAVVDGRRARLVSELRAGGITMHPSKSLAEIEAAHRRMTMTGRR